MHTPKRMGRAQPSDLWLEWDQSYKAIASFLRAHDFEDGSEFISADCEEPSLAIEVNDYMQLLQKSGTGWKKIEEGRWVRNHEEDKEKAPSAAITDTDD